MLEPEAERVSIISAALYSCTVYYNALSWQWIFNILKSGLMKNWEVEQTLNYCETSPSTILEFVVLEVWNNLIHFYAIVLFYAKKYKKGN
jgi:hypothetical protein